MLLAGMLLTSFIISASLIAISLAIQEFVGIATGESEYQISKIFIFAGGVVLCYAAAMVMGTILEAGYTNRVEKKIRFLLIGHIMESKQQLMEAYHSADIMTRLTVDTERVTNIMPQIFGQMAAEILPAIMALVTMLAMNWKMPSSLKEIREAIVISFVSPMQQKAAHKDVDNEGRNRSYMTEVFTHRSLFWVYRMREAVLRETKELYEQKAKSKLLLSFLQGITSFLNSFIGFALLFVTMGVGAVFAVKGEINVGTLIAMVQLTNYALLPINAMSGWIRKFSEVKASIDRIEKIMTLPVYEKQEAQTETDRKVASL